jgi:inosine-uridine nucleoside N-ribohydrolase
MLLQQYPDSKNLIKKIVIMGGAIKVPGNIIVPGYTDNLTNHKAEWNLYIDPVADNIVLNSGIPIFLVTLDITNKVPVNTNLVAKISSSTKTPILKTTIKMWQQTLAQHQPIKLWDSLAAVLSTNSTIGLYKKKGLAVSIQYKPCNNTTMKATKAAMRAIKKCINQAETGNLIPSVHNSNVFVYESFNIRKFKKLLFSTLNTYF